MTSLAQRNLLRFNSNHVPDKTRGKFAGFTCVPVPARKKWYSLSLKDLRYPSESQKEETRYPNVNSMCPKQKY